MKEDLSSKEARCVTNAARPSYAPDVIVGEIIKKGRKYLSMTWSACCRLTTIMNKEKKSLVIEIFVVKLEDRSPNLLKRNHCVSITALNERAKKV